MDWNGDGKHDGRDDAFYHNVINKDNNSNGGGGKGSSGGGGGTGCSSWVVDIVALGYLGVLLPGDIPINGFTMFIGLICAGRLGYTFLKWLYG